MRITRQLLRYGLVFLVCVAMSSAAWAAKDHFIDSDDYDDTDENVGLFLTDDHYRKMVEGFEYNGAEFDWGWVKSTGGKEHEPKGLAFDVKSYGTITIVKPIDHTSELHPNIEDSVADALTKAVERLGLKVVPSGGALELHSAIVDLNDESTYIYFTTIQPFIELEIKLIDTKAGEELLVIRDQEHGSRPESAASELASELLQFLK